jgi:hypothetical protein
MKKTPSLPWPSLVTHSIAAAALPRAATITPRRTAACLATPPPPPSPPPAPPPTLTAAYMTLVDEGAFLTSVVAEVTAVPVAATPADTLRYYVLTLSLSRTDEAQRGGHDGSTGELYSPAPRDRTGVQASRQVVKGASRPFSLHQQRNFSFPSFPPGGRLVGRVATPGSTRSAGQLPALYANVTWTAALYSCRR